MQENLISNQTEFSTKKKTNQIGRKCKKSSFSDDSFLLFPSPRHTTFFLCNCEKLEEQKLFFKKNIRNIIRVNLNVEKKLIKKCKKNINKKNGNSIGIKTEEEIKEKTVRK